MSLHMEIEPSPVTRISRWWRWLPRRGASNPIRHGGRQPADSTDTSIEVDLNQITNELIWLRDSATSAALAGRVIGLYEQLGQAAKVRYLTHLCEYLQVDAEPMVEAARAFVEDPSQANLLKLSEKTARPAGAFLAKLNHASGGTMALVRMRADLLDHRSEIPGAEVLDHSFFEMFEAWFNRGFLDLRRIDWTDSAEILENIIRYEAVHTIDNWEGLRKRVQPSDRMLFGFFHHRFGAEPLIFVEVALSKGMPTRIESILATPVHLDPNDADTAVFYSISNCHPGLKGVPLGNLLIKQVVAELSASFPNLKTYLTLSPVPGFTAWLKKAFSQQEVKLPDGFDDIDSLGAAIAAGEPESEEMKRIEKHVTPLAARYLALEKDRRGLPLDSVARFHLGNGARLEHVNFAGDKGPKGIAQALGFMVNYRYFVGKSAADREKLTDRRGVPVSSAVRDLLGQTDEDAGPTAAKKSRKREEPKAG